MFTNKVPYIYMYPKLRIILNANPYTICCVWYRSVSWRTDQGSRKQAGTHCRSSIQHTRTSYAHSASGEVQTRATRYSGDGRTLRASFHRYVTCCTGCSAKQTHSKRQFEDTCLVIIILYKLFVYKCLYVCLWFELL